MKERIRIVNIDRYECPKCHGDLHWDSGPRKYHCFKCNESFSQKIKVPIVEVQRYGFWLRFVSEHFIPCDECQENLDKMINKYKIALYDPHCITIEEYPKKDNWRFLLRFFAVGSLSGKDIFTPCKQCQSRILKNFDEKEIHIGNDNKPLVELWRKWDINDEATEYLQAREDWQKLILEKKVGNQIRK